MEVNTFERNVVNKITVILIPCLHPNMLSPSDVILILNVVHIVMLSLSLTVQTLYKAYTVQAGR